MIEMSAKNIKIYISCHKDFFVPQSNILYPIQVGAVFSNERFTKLSDDTGENISHLNKSYCELTAQYWAWKNDEADFYGFFHYRRYLDFSQQAKYAYRIFAKPNEKTPQLLRFDKIAKLIDSYDLIAPIGEDMKISVRDHYKAATFHHEADLQLVEEIIVEKHPVMCAATNKYLGGTINYFGNIYIMKKQLYFDYCSWLFDILAEYDKRKNTLGYGVQELRSDGYLAERLFGIYITWLQDQGKESILTVPRAIFEGIGSSGVKDLVRRITYLGFPPGSHRRHVLKKALCFNKRKV